MHCGDYLNQCLLAHAYFSGVGASTQVLLGQFHTQSLLLLQVLTSLWPSYHFPLGILTPQKYLIYHHLPQTNKYVLTYIHIHKPTCIKTYIPTLTNMHGYGCCHFQWVYIYAYTC